jgi:hypothetical protein
MDPKPWYESKTLWFNVVSLAVISAGVLADPGLISDPRIVAGAGALVTIGNAALRIFFTSQAIGRKR